MSLVDEQSAKLTLRGGVSARLEALSLTVTVLNMVSFEIRAIRGQSKGVRARVSSAARS